MKHRVPHRLPELGHLQPVAPLIWQRRAFHFIAGSIIPLLILFLPRSLVEWILIGASVGTIAFEVGRGMLPKANDEAVQRVPLFKPSERYVLTGSTFFILAATLIFFIFEKQFVVLALIFLVVGDPVAALVGRWDPKLRVFGKSLIGTAAFALSASIAGVAVAYHPDVELAWWLFAGAVVASVAELLPLPLDDNVVIPLAAATAMTLLAIL